MVKKRFYRILPLVLILLFLAGCGKSKSPSKSPSGYTPKLTSLQVSTPSVEKVTGVVVAPKGTQQFTAKGFDQKGKEIKGITFNWSVDTTEAGTISEGLFTADDNEGEYEVICEAKGIVRRVSVHVGLRQLTSIQVNTPSDVGVAGVMVAPTKTQQFMAKGLDQKGNEMENIDFTWSVDLAGMGTIDETGLFTAGETEGKCMVVCKAGDKEKQVSVQISTGSFCIALAGEQLVADSQTAWANFVQSPRLAKILNNQLMPSAGIIAFVFEETIDQVMRKELFYVEPGRYTEEGLWEIIWGGGASDTPYEGTWTYITEDWAYEDGTFERVVFGTWTLMVTREVVGENDHFTFDLRYKKADDETDTYEGMLIQPSLNLSEPEPGKAYSGHSEYQINFAIANGPSGALQLVGDSTQMMIIEEEYYDEEYDETYLEYDYIMVETTGNASGNFTYNGGAYAFDGTVRFLFDQNKEDSFVGTFTTPEAVIDGEVRLTYVANESLAGKPLFEGYACDLVPNKLTVNGSLADRASDLLLAGTFKLELKNAATFNFSDQYTASNWPGVELNFSGTLCNEVNNQLAGTLSFEETAFKKFRVNVGYDLTSDGVQRKISLNATSANESEIKIGIISDWGPAQLNMNLGFTPGFLYDNGFGDLDVGTLDTLSGNVLVNGVEVGEICLHETFKVPMVKYHDGTSETF